MTGAAEPLRVVALISGGKDSFYSLLHSLAQGHDVVALANLHPLPALAAPPRVGAAPPDPRQPADDLESHMYQTVGHAAVPLCAAALGLPLHRAPITGRAVDTALEYGGARAGEEGADRDETEALAALLRAVLAAHPQVNAVCAGAILSTYQRTRVEDVATRLGLVPLAPLWQYPRLPCPAAAPGSLLEDAAAAGLDARIVKVASGGLDESFLWASLADPAVRQRLAAAVRRFGGSVLGEGGEYETLVVAGPPGVWRGKVSVAEESSEVVRLGGGEALLRIGAAEVVAAEGEDKGNWRGRVRMPAMFDSRFEEALRKVEGADLIRAAAPESERLHAADDSWSFQPAASRSALTLRVSNLTRPGGTAIEQTEAVSAELLEKLRSEGLSADDVVFTTILLRSMADFAGVNAVYAKLFTKPLPPARVTVAAGDLLAEGVHVAVSVAATLAPASRRTGLHVQSWSYWAPANIGPYSQAISVPVGTNCGAAFVAGQIPLVPATMQPLMEDMLKSAALSAQHLWRIGLAMDVGWWAGAIAFVAGNDCNLQARQCAELWRVLHEAPAEAESDDDDGDAGFDVWHQRHGGAASFGEEQKEKTIPNFDAVSGATDASAWPGMFAVEVHELPRGCGVEWQSLGFVGGAVALSRDTHGAVTCSLTAQGNAAVRVTFHEVTAPDDVADALDKLGLLASPSGPPTVHATLYTPEPSRHASRPVHLVPCKRIWGQAGRELVAGVVVYEER